MKKHSGCVVLCCAGADVRSPAASSGVAAPGRAGHGRGAMGFPQGGVPALPCPAPRPWGTRGNGRQAARAAATQHQPQQSGGVAAGAGTPGRSAGSLPCSAQVCSNYPPGRQCQPGNLRGSHSLLPNTFASVPGLNWGAPPILKQCMG